jgi:hypothetical protein
MIISQLPAGMSPPKCIACSKEVKCGGFYSGQTDFALCSECVRFDDLRQFGIALGDALLDAYLRGFPRDRIHPVTLVPDVLRRIESAIWRALASGLYVERDRARE